MYKKIWVLAAIVLFAMAAGMLLCRLLLSGGEDAWICENGAWVKHGQPSVEMPAYECPGAREANNQRQDNSEKQSLENARVTTLARPVIGEFIESPLVVSGTMPGNWFFEATAKVVLMDGNNKVLATAPATAAGDWMTTSSVLFAATLVFDAPATATGTLILKNDNPSGLPENDLFESYVVNFFHDYKNVKIFFSNSKMNSDTVDCSKVYPVVRRVANAANIAELAISELLKGPTDEALGQGYFTSINEGVKLQKISIKNGTASVDFDAKIQEGLGGSCRVAAIRAQIEQTLKQFLTIKDVVISVNGRTDEALQP